jgi:hypothetical protein
MKRFAGIFPGLIAVMMVFGVAAFAEEVRPYKQQDQTRRTVEI